MVNGVVLINGSNQTLPEAIHHAIVFNVSAVWTRAIIHQDSKLYLESLSFQSGRCCTSKKLVSDSGSWLTGVCLDHEQAYATIRVSGVPSVLKNTVTQTLLESIQSHYSYQILVHMDDCLLPFHLGKFGFQSGSCCTPGQLVSDGVPIILHTHTKYRRH